MSGYLRREIAALVVLAAVALGATAWAAVYARMDIRDDLRKTDIANIRRALEQYNNDVGHYGTPPPGETSCTANTDDTSWFFDPGSPLVPEYTDAIPHDVREGQGHEYRFCVTDIQDGKTTGYYLQAVLERDERPRVAVDEDERRKYEYRVLMQDGRTLYRVCGGTEPQCRTDEQ